MNAPLIVCFRPETVNYDKDELFSHDPNHPIAIAGWYSAEDERHFVDLKGYDAIVINHSEN